MSCTQQRQAGATSGSPSHVMERSLRPMVSAERLSKVDQDLDLEFKSSLRGYFIMHPSTMPRSALLCSWAVRAPMNGFSMRPCGRLPVLCCTPVCRGVMNLRPQIERGRPFKASCRSATPSTTRSGANKIRRPGCCPPNSSYQKHFIPDVNPTGLEYSTRQTRMQEMI